jgi:3-hydroxymyristoyl/3-hydroxydecanoyl-(acyl carrier protein) dehydratase
LIAVVNNELIVDLSLLDFDHPIADLEAIRKLNRQRYEMEQLTAVLYENLDKMTCAGYLQTSEDSFWTRGHMPGMPIMPGVIMLESVAQLSSFFTQRNDLLGADVVGFGGVDGVRFRGVVLPGDTFVVMIHLARVRRNRMIVAHFQGLVDGNIVVDGEIRGIPIPVDTVNQYLADRAK